MGCIRTLKDRSSTPLGVSAKFTGNGFKTELYNQVRVLASSDKSGAVNLEESNDGVTWYQTATSALTGGTPLAARFFCHAYYARVVYANSTDAQAAFDLQVYVDPFGV